MPPSRSRVALSRWTILLPTRRAAKQLGLTLLRATGQKAILLPQIRPIGDLDDTQVLNQDAELPASISSTGQFFTILSLLDQWAKENPLIVLAQEIINSQSQAIALATSLVKLVDQIETEEVNLAKIGEAYEADLSEHRNAILSLLSIIRNELPKRLHEENLLSRPDHRNRALRGEAKRITHGGQQYPSCVSKAFCAGADFNMYGSMFSGYEESGGDTVEKNGKKYKEYFGSSSNHAMQKLYGKKDF